MPLRVPDKAPSIWGEQLVKSVKEFVDAMRAEFDLMKQDYMGATEPLVPYPRMCWADTTASVLKVRNLANSAWVVVGPIE